MAYGTWVCVVQARLRRMLLRRSSNAKPFARGRCAALCTSFPRETLTGCWQPRVSGRYARARAVGRSVELEPDKASATLGAFRRTVSRRALDRCLSHLVQGPPRRNVRARRDPLTRIYGSRGLFDVDVDQAFLVSQKISAISSILAIRLSATATSSEPLVPPAPASLVASLNRPFNCGYFSK